LYRKFAKAFRHADLLTGKVDFEAQGIDMEALKGNRQPLFVAAYNAARDAYRRFSAESRKFRAVYDNHIARFNELLRPINETFG